MWPFAKADEDWLGKADGLAGRGVFAEALGCYERALLKAPGHEGALCGKARCLRKLGRPQEGIAVLDAALAAKPNFARAWVSKSQCLAALQQDDEAMAAVDRGLMLLRRTAVDDAGGIVEFEALALKAGLALRLGRRLEAVSCLRDLALAAALLPPERQAGLLDPLAPLFRQVPEALDSLRPEARDSLAWRPG